MGRGGRRGALEAAQCDSGCLLSCRFIVTSEYNGVLSSRTVHDGKTRERLFLKRSAELAEGATWLVPVG